MKMKKQQHIFLIFLLVILSLKSFATHIVGGEVYYDCLGGNNYKITLKLYRDCFNGIPPFDNPASVFIFNSAGIFIDSLEIPAPSSVFLPFPLTHPCLVPPTNICVEEAIYEVIVNLPPLAGGYNLSYQRCCRNGTILNLILPGNVGSTYMAHIPDPAIAVCNSSPRYNNFPPIFLCAGVPLNFDHSATDLDSDSLYYELCDAFTGLDPSCPILGAAALLNGGACPTIASPPPYPLVPWLAPYSGTNPMSSSPMIAVNPTTGMLTGTPNMVGQWVVAVCVSEFRNGILIDVNKRDFQFNVVECGIPVASIPILQPFCFGSPSNFSQNSINAITYHWDFGDTLTSIDTSNIQSPTWTYTNTGTFNLTLIVNPGTPCTDTANLLVTVNPVPLMNSANAVSICSGATATIILSSTLPSSYTWIATDNINTTGESTTLQSGSTLSNTIINNTASIQTVTYTITPTSTPLGCTGSPQTVTVTINPGPSLDSISDITICNGGNVIIPLSSNNAATYTWYAADNLNTSGESTSIQTSNPLNNTIINNTSTIQTIIYTITPTSTAFMCVGNPLNINVNVNPTPIITNVLEDTICNGETVIIPLASNVISTFTWIALDNINTSGESTTLQTGGIINNTIINATSVGQTINYTATPTTVAGSCIGTPQTISLLVNPSATITNVPSDTICNGDLLNILLTSNMTSTYNWVAIDNPNISGESTTVQSVNPLINILYNNTAILQTLIYTITPTSSPEGCIGSAQTISVIINPSAFMTNTNTATICDSGTVNIPLTSSMPSSYSWVAADNPNTTGESTTLQFSNPLINTIQNTSTSIQNVIYTITPTMIIGTCNGIPQTLTVSILPLPIITSPTSASICSGESFNIGLTSDTTATFSWVALDNANTSGESIIPGSGNLLSDTITNNTSVTQTVNYMVTPTSVPNGCEGVPQLVTISVFNGIEADFDFVTIPCTFQVAFYDSSAVGPVSWLWNFDDGDTSSTQNPQHDFDTLGTYNIQLITSTINGCKDTVNVDVNFVPANPFLINPSDTICLGTSSQLFASGGFSYVWTPPLGLNNSFISNPIANPDTTTLYSVSILNVDTFGDTCLHNLTTTVYVIDPAIYSLNATTDEDTLIQGESTIMHAITDTSLAVYWTPLTGLGNPSSFNPTVTPESTTTYTVSILDSFGCQIISSVTIYIVPKYCDESEVFVPNTFTPNGDGNNDILFVRGKQIKELYFAVYNRRGELVFETTNINTGWNGIYNGAKADPDIFAWYLRAVCFNNGKLQSKGNVTLVK